MQHFKRTGTQSVNISTEKSRDNIYQRSCNSTSQQTWESIKSINKLSFGHTLKIHHAHWNHCARRSRYFSVRISQSTALLASVYYTIRNFQRERKLDTTMWCLFLFYWLQVTSACSIYFYVQRNDDIVIGVVWIVGNVLSGGETVASNQIAESVRSWYTTRSVVLNTKLSRFLWSQDRSEWNP